LIGIVKIEAAATDKVSCSSVCYFQGRSITHPHGDVLTRHGYKNLPAKVIKVAGIRAATAAQIN